MLRRFLRKTLVAIGVYGLYRIIQDNRNALNAWRCSRRYEKLLSIARQKPRGEKIRVLFIVSEIAKWKEQFLYDVMEQSGEFYPIVGISAWNLQSEKHLSPMEYAETQKKAETFFDRMGARYVRTVTIEDDQFVYHDLREFSPDVVFYTEQWGPCRYQSPFEVSEFALTAFLPYYVPDFGIEQIDCRQNLHLGLHAYFCLGNSWADLYRHSLRWIAHSTRFVVTGHPALDYFNSHKDVKPSGNCVIYAPHFAFPHPSRSDTYLIGTFEWSGLPILEYAEKHPEIQWVFKPHPLLKKVLHETEILSDAEINDYYNRWSKIAAVSVDADYQEIFLSSRAMITDSGSFLPEYGSTGRPVVRLICSQNKHVPPKAAKDVYDTYYQVHDVSELMSTFALVIENGEDPNQEQRLLAVERAGLREASASQNIVTYLLGLFGRRTCR